MQADDAPQNRPAIRIIPEEYDAFVRLIPGDERLPRLYEEWVERSTRADAERTARGEQVKKVVIHSEEFADHCLAKNQEPSYRMLEDLAAEKVSRGS